MDYKNGAASENIANFSVCVRDGVNIRHIKNKNDLSGNLVLVNNIIPYECKEEVYIIPAGTEVRYIDISIVPKLTL